MTLKQAIWFLENKLSFVVQDIGHGNYAVDSLVMTEAEVIDLAITWCIQHGLMHYDGED